MKDKIIDFFKYEKNKLVHYVRKRINYIASRDPEDIVQDVMLKIIERVNEGLFIENVSSFVYKSVNNKIIDNYRTKKETISLNSENDDNFSLSDILSDIRYDTFSAVERSDLQKVIFEEVNKLPDEQKSIWIATEIEGKTFSELSLELDLSINTLLSRKHRALKVLKSKLSDWMV